MPARSSAPPLDVAALLGSLAEHLSRARSPGAIGPALAAQLAAAAPLDGLSLMYGASGQTFRHGLDPLPGDRTLVVALPPERPGEAAGELRLALGRASDRASLEGSAAVALGQVVGAALRAARVLSRLAQASKRAHDENRELRAGAGALVPVAASAAMRTLLWETAPLVARQDTTVLLRGESGTGKEVVARAIHALSPRAARPFVPVNCGALPETLVESELFGHEKGAFTGATARRPGVFERAHGGTVFLDEVGDLPPGAQVKLLRVLQDGHFERVGGVATVHADVRVIAATHRPLEAMVAAAAFRADLYYRLDVFPIVIPPLRERPDDIPALASALLARLAARHGRRPPALTDDALARLRAHPFPGNVRELANLLERALILSLGDTLLLPPLPPPTAPAPPAPGPPAGPPSAASLRDVMASTVAEALRQSGGRIHGPGGAAERLGLPPTTLQSKLKKLGLRRRDFQP